MKWINFSEGVKDQKLRILYSGEPGAGKTTAILSFADRMNEEGEVIDKRGGSMLVIDTENTYGNMSGVVYGHLPDIAFACTRDLKEIVQTLNDLRAQRGVLNGKKFDILAIDSVSSVYNALVNAAELDKSGKDANKSPYIRANAAFDALKEAIVNVSEYVHVLLAAHLAPNYTTEPGSSYFKRSGWKGVFPNDFMYAIQHGVMLMADNTNPGPKMQRSVIFTKTQGHQPSSEEVAQFTGFDHTDPPWGWKAYKTAFEQYANGTGTKLKIKRPLTSEESKQLIAYATELGANDPLGFVKQIIGPSRQWFDGIDAAKDALRVAADEAKESSE